jgi:hypothetical protein
MTMKLSELKANIAAARAQMRENGKEALMGAFRDFFEANTDVEAIMWHQYTPYFNDGDACVFRVGEFYFKPTVVPEGDFYYDYEDDFFSIYERGKGLSELSRKVKTFAQEIEDEDIFEIAFGDHCKCVATINGVEVSTYRHD